VQNVDVAFLHGEGKNKLSEFCGNEVPWNLNNIRYPIEREGELFEVYSKFNNYENTLNYDLNSDVTPFGLNSGIKKINQEIKNDNRYKSIKINANIGNECAQDYVSYGTSQKCFTRIVDTYGELVFKLNNIYETINGRVNKKKSIFIKYGQSLKMRKIVDYNELIHYVKNLINESEFKLTSKIEENEINIEDDDDIQHLPNNSTINVELI
jgi:hypothetical protein